MLKKKLKTILTPRTAASCFSIAGAVSITYGCALLWAPLACFVGGGFCLWASYVIEWDLAEREAPRMEDALRRGRTEGAACFGHRPSPPGASFVMTRRPSSPSSQQAAQRQRRTAVRATQEA